MKRETDSGIKNAQRSSVVAWHPSSNRPQSTAPLLRLSRAHHLRYPIETTTDLATSLLFGPRSWNLLIILLYRGIQLHKMMSPKLDPHHTCLLPNTAKRHASPRSMASKFPLILQDITGSCSFASFAESDTIMALRRSCATHRGCPSLHGLLMPAPS